MAYIRPPRYGYVRMVVQSLYYINSLMLNMSINSYQQKLPQQVSFPSVRNGIHRLLHTPIQAHLHLDNCNETLSPSVDKSEHVDHD